MSLHIESLGKGPDLVLLHGWGWGGAVWAETARALSVRFRVHCADLPGYGKSPRCTPYTPARAVEILAQALPRETAVCGWSLGGQLALSWAAHAPAQIKRLVLVSATPCFMQRAAWPHGAARTVLDDFARELATDPRAARARFALLAAQDDAHAREVARALQGVPASESDALAETLQWLDEIDLRAALPALTVPALVIHGDRDAVTPWAAGAALAQRLPAARRVTFHGAGHAPFLSEPAQFVHQLTRAL